eukprot:6048543-Prymnesium_polylepis.2
MACSSTLIWHAATPQYGMQQHPNMACMQHPNMACMQHPNMACAAHSTTRLAAATTPLPVGHEEAGGLSPELTTSAKTRYGTRSCQSRDGWMPY